MNEGPSPSERTGANERRRQQFAREAPQRLMELAPSRGDDELTRRPMAHVVAAGFRIEESDRLRAGIVERLAARRL